MSDASRREVVEPSSPRLPIRPGMDVYDAYQDEYIGTVVRVWEARGSGSAAERGLPGKETGSQLGATENPHIQHEEGESVDPTGFLGSHPQLGEEMGPFPTVGMGNTGPTAQSAKAQYATGITDRKANVYLFAVRPGRINWGFLTAPLYIPTASIDSVSMERVVLNVRKRDIPSNWLNPPDV